MKPQVHVIGLGPGGPDLVTAGALELIGAVPTQFLRTERHPAASVMPHAQWFDLLYESAESMDQVYPAIVEALIRSAHDNGEVLYAVPGSPVVAEHSVELLIADERVTTIIHPALSFLDLTWARLGVDPVETGVSFVDGHDFAVAAAGLTGPLLVGQCDNRFVLSDIKLSVEQEPTEPVTVLARLGLPDEAIFSVDWQDLDRSFEPDHLTSLWIPQMGSSAASELNKLLEAISKLRLSSDMAPEDAVSAAPTNAEALPALAAVVAAQLDRYDTASGVGVEELEAGLAGLLLELVTLSSDLESDGWSGLTEVISRAAGQLRNSR